MVIKNKWDAGIKMDISKKLYMNDFDTFWNLSFIKKYT
jgi:hypothetical protein